MHRRTLVSRLLHAIFAIAICIGYLGVALGLLGYVSLGKAYLVTLVAGSVACVDVGIFFTLSYESLVRRSHIR
jgi:hypothetical protein